MEASAVIAIGIVGSVASVISLLIAAPGLKSKFLHLGYALFITILSIVTFRYQRELEDLKTFGKTSSGNHQNC